MADHGSEMLLRGFTTVRDTGTCDASDAFSTAHAICRRREQGTRECDCGRSCVGPSAHPMRQSAVADGFVILPYWNVSYALTYVAMQVDMPISGRGTPEQAAVVDILTRSDARAMECRRC